MRVLVASAFLAAFALPSFCRAAPPFPEAVQGVQGGWHTNADYVLWWLRRSYLPPILTTSPPASAGLLGQSGTRIVYGDQRPETRHQDRFNGLRFVLEWMNPEGTFGVEGRAFFLERDSTYFTLKQRNDVLLALAYTDAATGQERALAVAGPSQRGLLWGGFVGYSRVELFGQELNAVVPLFSSEDGARLDLLAGARFLQMRDRYHHTATSLEEPSRAVLSGVNDNFRVGNRFYGGQLGLRGEQRWSPFFLQGRSSIALGADDILVRNFGQRVRHTPQERIVQPVGLFVQPGNCGRFTHCRFDAVAEVAVNGGVYLTDNLRVFAGYTFLWWADPARATEQVERLVNQEQRMRGPAVPGVSFRGDAFWAQGLNLGIEARW